jgi:enoyl-CoA hydratase/carnithine racemase
MAYKKIIVERDGGVVVIKLNNPERMNAGDPEMTRELHEELDRTEADPESRVVVLTGVGKAFSGGYDIRGIPTNPDPEVERIIREANPLELGLGAVRDYPYPVIAMIRGACFGGALNLAMCCDLRLGADDVAIGMPPAKLGLVYPARGIAQFVAVLGAARAREVFFTGKTYRGADALAMGLIDHMFAAGELEHATYVLAGEIASNAPLALRGLKRIFGLLQDAAKLSDEAQAEADALVTASFSSADAVEGQLAFLEKRRPRFTER